MSTREENNPNQGGSGQNPSKGGTTGQQGPTSQQGSTQNTNQGSNQGQGSYQDSNQSSNAGKNKPFEITGNWGRQSSKLKEEYKQLTDSDLQFEPGKENQLLDKIGTRLNKSRDEVIDIINRYEM